MSECLIPNCSSGGKVYHRGVCNHCHHILRGYVNGGKTTWKELETFGIVEEVALCEDTIRELLTKHGIDV